MNEFDVAEQAYRNGYEAGKADALKWISVKDKNNRPKDGEQVWCYGTD